MFGADGLISRNTSSGTIFYAFDERGNVAHRMSSTGAVLSSDLYDAYGKQLAGASDVYGFEAQAGYRTDPETGLLLLTHRYYDPATGRFVTRDPIGYDGGINLYGYTQNNPVNESDPSGFYPTLPAIPPVLPPKDGVSYYWYNHQWNRQPQPGTPIHRNKWTWGKNAAEEGHDPHYDYRNGRNNTECRYYPGKDDPTIGEWEPKRGGSSRTPVQGPPAPLAGDAGEAASLGAAEDALEALGPAGMIIGAGIAIWQWHRDPMNGTFTLLWTHGDRP